MSGKPAPCRRWLQVSLKTLLIVMLLVCTFFAGRSSRQTELDRVRMDIERSRVKAEEIQQQLQQQVIVAPMVRGHNWRTIEEGMKADALERGF